MGMSSNFEVTLKAGSDTGTAGTGIFGRNQIEGDAIYGITAMRLILSER